MAPGNGLICAAQDAVQFLLAWAPDGLLWSLSAIDPARPGWIETRTFDADKVTACETWISAHNDNRHNVYFSTNQPRLPMDKKAEKADIDCALALHVDVDPREPPDGANPDEWYAAEHERILGIILAYPRKPTVIVFSGGGYQAFWKFEQPFEIEDFEKDVAKVEACNRGLEQALGGDKCHNVDRIMRLPFTVNWPSQKKIAAGRVPMLSGVVEADWDLLYSIHDFVAVPEAVEEAGPTVARKPRPQREWVTGTVIQGNFGRYNGDESRAVWAACLGMARDGRTREEIIAALLNKANAIAGHVFRQGNPQSYARRQADKALHVAGNAFKMVTKGQRKGLPVSDHDNLDLALSKLGVEFSYNIFLGHDMIEGPDKRPLRRYVDRDENLILNLLDRQFGLRPNRDYLAVHTTVECDEHRYHPVCDYLAALTWDGVPRIDTWLIDYAGAKDTLYVRAISRIILMAAVRRVREPGVKYDEMVVLISTTQGLDKSSGLRVLAVNNDWFTDTVPLDAKDQKILEQLEGKWIIEASELKGMKNIDHLKSMLSRQVDSARKAYGRARSDAPRQSVFFGTTNNDVFLRDPTGNRRFWPVAIVVLDVAKLTANRDQLWAEAAEREAAGESIRLPKELYEAAALEQDRRTIVDPWLDEFRKHLGTIGRGKMLCGDALALVRVPIDRRTSEHNARMGECMRALGWERKKLRHNGHPHWHYVKGTGMDGPIPYVDVVTDFQGTVHIEIRSAEDQQDSLALN